MTITRRQFAPAAALATLAASPAFAQQTSENVKWRLTSSFPKSLDTLFGASNTVARVVGELTDGKFQLQVFAAGEIVPGLQVLDAVQAGTVEAGHTAMYYYWGKDPTFAFSTAVPFGLNERNQTSWYMQGGGIEAMREFMRSYNVTTFLCGSTGAQMGGWFRREINTVADLQGLKMRIPGLGGQVMSKLGVTVQALPANEIFQALQTGAVDAAEWVGPYDDEKLGLNTVAEYYYHPGWWEPGAALEVEVNLTEWNNLPQEYQEIIKVAAMEANTIMQARYEGRNGAALARMIAAGTALRTSSEEILTAAAAATVELYDEVAAADADFKSIYEQWSAFRAQAYGWNKINELPFANFAFGQV